MRKVESKWKCALYCRSWNWKCWTRNRCHFQFQLCYQEALLNFDSTIQFLQKKDVQNFDMSCINKFHQNLTSCIASILSLWNRTKCICSLRVTSACKWHRIWNRWKKVFLNTPGLWTLIRPSRKGGGAF